MKKLTEREKEKWREEYHRALENSSIEDISVSNDLLKTPNVLYENSASDDEGKLVRVPKNDNAKNVVRAALGW